jgi:hypothetical protein
MHSLSYWKEDDKIELIDQGDFEYGAQQRTGAEPTPSNDAVAWTRGLSSRASGPGSGFDSTLDGRANHFMLEKLNKLGVCEFCHWS